MNCSNSQCTIMKLLNDIGVDSCIDVHNRQSDPYQFAAVDAHIDHMELPLLDSTDMHAQSQKLFNGCILDDKIDCATMFAILGTYTNASNIIVFHDGTSGIDSLLNIIAEHRIIYSPGVTIKICPVESDSKLFDITIYETGVSIRVTEGRMLSIASNLALNECSIICYLYPGSVGYANPITTSMKSIWITNGSDLLSVVGADGYKLMPKFYCVPSIECTYRLNTGAARIEFKRHVSVQQTQLNSTVMSLLNAVTKDKRCYYCQYMNRVHRQLCSKHLQNKVVVTKVEYNLPNDV